MKFFIKKGFTLTELIVAVTISTILLVFVFKFVADTVAVLSETTTKSRILLNFYEFTVRLDNYMNTFPVSSLVQDYPQGNGYDVLMLKTYDGKAGVLVGVVNKDTMQLDSQSNSAIFGKKVLGFRDLTQADITAIGTTSSIVYTYTFFPDKIFESSVMKNFQIGFYNGGNLVDMNVDLMLSEMKDLYGTNWKFVPQSDIYTVDINF